MREGWEIKKLGDVCKVIAGQSPEGKYYNSEGKGLPFYQGKKEYGAKFLGEPTTWTTKVTKEAEDGDILMSVRAPVGPINIATQKICIGRGLAAIRAGININQEFLYNFLLKHENEIEGNEGAVFNSINKSQIAAIEIPLPSLPEQQRIVAILDECFAALEKAKANAEQNLKNAKELFESYLQGVFESSNYGNLEFGEICELVGGSQPSKEQFIYEPLEGYIRLIQVRDYRTEKFITYIPKSSAKRFCNKDDIMIGRYGPPIFGIFKGLEGAYNVALIKAIVNESLCDKDYFYWFLKNTKLREFVEQSSKRAVGQDGIRKELLEKYPVPLPPLSEQQTIVRKLDTLRAETQKLEAIYQQKLADLEELKKSILQKAFAGELTSSLN
jgi:type I restriction enzyme S subunit